MELSSHKKYVYHFPYREQNVFWRRKAFKVLGCARKSWEEDLKYSQKLQLPFPTPIYAEY